MTVCVCVCVCVYVYLSGKSDKNRHKCLMERSKPAHEQ